MLSKKIIGDERSGKQSVQIETNSMFTGVVDTWATSAKVVGASTITAVPSVGLSLMAISGVGNGITLKSSFGIRPRYYRRVRIITIFDTVNCDFITIPLNSELSIGLLTSDSTSFSQIILQGNRGVRSRVNGVTSPEYPSMKPTDVAKRKTIEIVWDTDENYIDIFENHIFIHRIAGAELPDKGLTYHFEMTLKNGDAVSHKGANVRKLWFQLET